MPTVIVHGVNVRRERPGFEAGRQLISNLCKRNLSGLNINGKCLSDTDPMLPYWGDLGVSFAWNEASMPSEGEFESLGSMDPIEALLSGIELLPAGEGDDNPLLQLANSNGLSSAVEVLSQVLLARAPVLKGKSEQDDQESRSESALIASLIADMQEYALRDERPDWLATARDDKALIELLVIRLYPENDEDSDVIEGLGGMDFARKILGSAGSAIRGSYEKVKGYARHRGGDYVSRFLMSRFRNPINTTLGTFFGDIFVYLDNRDKDLIPSIHSRILEHVEKAASFAAANREPLVIVGHSLGGVVLFDILSHYRSDIDVDLFVTVGSQVTHFEECKLYKSSKDGIPSDDKKRAVVPPNIKRWINIFDPVDLFGYSASKVFDRVEDYEYDCRTNTIDAHSAYLAQDRFYRRLKDRIIQPKVVAAGGGH